VEEASSNVFFCQIQVFGCITFEILFTPNLTMRAGGKRVQKKKGILVKFVFLIVFTVT